MDVLKYGLIVESSTFAAYDAEQLEGSNTDIFCQQLGVLQASYPDLPGIWRTTRKSRDTRCREVQQRRYLVQA